DFGLGLDVGGSTTESTRRLVQKHARVRGDVPLALVAGGEQELPHRGCQADTDGDDVVRNELHRVVDRHSCRDRATGRVDVQVDVTLRVFCGEKKYLRADLVGVVITHL